MLKGFLIHAPTRELLHLFPMLLHPQSTPIPLFPFLWSFPLTSRNKSWRMARIPFKQSQNSLLPAPHNKSSTLVGNGFTGKENFFSGCVCKPRVGRFHSSASARIARFDALKGSWFGGVDLHWSVLPRAFINFITAKLFEYLWEVYN